MPRRQPALSCHAIGHAPAFRGLAAATPVPAIVIYKYRGRQTRLKAEHEVRLVGQEYAAFLDLLGSLREEVAAREPDLARRARLWYRLVDSDVMAYLKRGDAGGARRRVTALLESATPAARDG